MTVSALVLALWWWLVPAAEGAGPYVRAEWPWVTAGCQTTRTRVLIRDAQDVTLDPTQCKVVAGTWRDPYTATTITQPSPLDIDHVVPLAWVAAHGGAAWDAPRKRAYANDLGYRYHLWAVSAPANRAKGAQGPDTWRPAARAVWCQYGQAWATVLITWDLTPDAATRAAIRDLVRACS